MKFLNFKTSLRAKIQLYVMTAAIGILALVITVIVVRARTMAMEMATEQALTKSKLASIEVERYLQTAYLDMKALMRMQMDMRRSGDKNRADYISSIKSTLSCNPNYLAVWAMWEPNALDSNDKAFIDDPMYDSEGRFNCTFFKSNNDILSELSSGDNYSEDYYTIASKSGKELLLEPYTYQYSPNLPEVFETTLAVPLVESGKTLAVFGVDILLTQLNELNKTIKLFQTGYGIMISNKGIIVAHPDQELIGKSVSALFGADSTAVLRSIDAGEKLELTAESAFLKCEAMHFFQPVRITGSTEPWAVCAVVPSHEAMFEANNIMWISLAVGAIGIIVFGLVMSLLANGIVKPILASINAAKEVAGGNLTGSLAITTADEIGDLGIAINKMRDSLKELMGSVTTTSKIIISNAQQLSSASQQLSSSTNEQAASLEEISSSVEQMAASISQNSLHAKGAEAIATSATSHVDKVNSTFDKTLHSLRLITNKITIIHEVAERTDLLAVNASIEAAKAGENGKGFAVVASEVRNLAIRCRDAADEIDKISAETVDASNESAKMLGGLIPEIQKTASLIQEIAAASAEQDAGAQQINIALVQLNSVTQQNSASSEELTASAVELKDLSYRLRDAIAYLVIDTAESDDVARLLEMISKHNSEIAKIEARIVGRKQEYARPAPPVAETFYPASPAPQAPAEINPVNSFDFAIKKDNTGDDAFERF